MANKTKPPKIKLELTTQEFQTLLDLTINSYMKMYCDEKKDCKKIGYDELGEVYLHLVKINDDIKFDAK